MRSLPAFLVLGAFLFANKGQASVRCGSMHIPFTTTGADFENSPGGLIQKIWATGLSHPIYKRPGVQRYLEKFKTDMDLSGVSPASGTILIEPEPGATGLNAVGGFSESNGVLTMTFWLVQITTRPRFAFLSNDVLPFGERPRGLNVMMPEFIAALEGAAKLYGERHLSVRQLHAIAADIQSPSVKQLFEKAKFTPTQGKSNELSKWFKFRP